VLVLPKKSNLFQKLKLNMHLQQNLTNYSMMKQPV
jgi:hypothetical protein